MLEAKAQKVIFLVGGREVRAPATHYMLHDEAGRAWPRTSVLVGTFEKTGEPLSGSSRWFGGDYEMRAGRLELPPKRLDEWRQIGVVDRIYYDRRGLFALGTYKHDFKEGGVWIFKREKPVLYKRAGFYRLEFPSGAVINWRGFVSP